MGEAKRRKTLGGGTGGSLPPEPPENDDGVKVTVTDDSQLHCFDRNSTRFLRMRLPFSGMQLSERFGLDQDLDTRVAHDDAGLFLFDISGEDELRPGKTRRYQFSLEAPSALKLWNSISRAHWEWLNTCLAVECDLGGID